MPDENNGYRRGQFEGEVLARLHAIENEQRQQSERVNDHHIEIKTWFTQHDKRLGFLEREMAKAKLISGMIGAVAAGAVVTAWKWIFGHGGHG